MQFIRKYGTAAKVRIPVVKASSADFAVSGDWTPATGDVKISKDGGNVANITTLPVAVGALWEFAISATEMQAAEITIQVVDAATKAVQDQAVSIITFGNASAALQIDWSDSVRAGLTALPNVASGSAGAIPTTGTGANQISVTSGGVDIQTIKTNPVVNGGTITFPSNATVASTGGAVGSVTGAVGSVTGLTASDVGAIKLKTDNLPSDPADASDIAAAFGVVGSAISGLNDLSQADVRTAVGLASANLDTQIGTLASQTSVDTIDGIVDAILDDTGTAGVVVAAASKTGYSLSAAGLAAFFITDTTKVYGDAVAGSVVAEIAENAGGGGLSASDIADEVQTRTIAAVTLVNGLADNSVTAAALAMDAVTEIQSGLATSAALSTVASYVDTEVGAIKLQTDKLTFDGANHIVADARKISTSATAADNLEAGSTALVPGTCAAGSTTTIVETNLTEATDDHYNGRVISFISGDLAGQTTSISDYNGTTKTLTVVALTEPPDNLDAFVIS